MEEAYAVSDHTTYTVADKLATEFITRYGIPNQIHTYQGGEFESELFSELCKLWGIKKTRTTPYRPQSDELVEILIEHLLQCCLPLLTIIEMIGMIICLT